MSIGWYNDPEDGDYERGKMLMKRYDLKHKANYSYFPFEEDFFERYLEQRSSFSSENEQLIKEYIRAFEVFDRKKDLSKEECEKWAGIALSLLSFFVSDYKKFQYLSTALKINDSLIDIIPDSVLTRFSCSVELFVVKEVLRRNGIRVTL